MVIVMRAGTGVRAATAHLVLIRGASVVLNGRCEHKLADAVDGIDLIKLLLHTGDLHTRSK